MADGAADPDFMASLARGLAVLRCFTGKERPLTIAQASRETGFSRSAVRRCLHTLACLGYVAQEGPAYTLRPKVLELGHAFQSSSTLATRAQPLLDQLRDELRESCSLGVLEDDQVYYIARAEVGRIMSVALRVGSRLPAYCTSMGRVLMAGQDLAARESYLRRSSPEQFTGRTETDSARLLAIFDEAGREGFAVVDQELELGLRSIAVPVRRLGGTVAAINIGAPAARVSLARLRDDYLPALRRVARMLETLL